VKTQRLEINTGRQRKIVDITEDVNSFVTGEGDGLLSVSLPHATAGLALMELGSGSEEDLFDRLDDLLPRNHRYRHSHGSQGHGADHLLPAFIAPTLTLPVIGGRVSLGSWQRIAMIDTNLDNPRREVVLAFLPSRG
jgi:secondary thiamine-phosphate synthase enzyme